MRYIRFSLIVVFGAFLSGCGGANQSSTITPPTANGGSHSHHVRRNVSCVSIQDSTGTTYTAARTGGGDHIDVEYSSQACEIGIYINGLNGPNTLDHTTVNGAFPIGIYFDNAGNAHEDHTQICVNGSNPDGACNTGTGTSPGTGLYVRNTPKLAIDHTSIDGYMAGYATNACPNSGNQLSADHTVITNATYPWSYEGGNNNFNFQAGHDSPSFNGQSCAGSAVGSGAPGGNVYVGDFNNNAVKEILAPGYTTVETLGSGFDRPYGVAVDASGNVFVADEFNNAVKEILAPGYTTVETLGSGFAEPTGVAVDPSGNVYVADQGNSEVKEILAPSYTTVETLGSGFSHPYGVAVDAGGNVYVADTFSNEVKEILAPSYTTVETLGSGFADPTGVAVDPSGNVYVADANNHAVKEILAPGYTTINTLGSGFHVPEGVAVDATGNVYVADAGNNEVNEILAAGGYTTIDTLGSGFNGPSGERYRIQPYSTSSSFTGSSI